jgi:hypothetical protein
MIELKYLAAPRSHFIKILLARTFRNNVDPDQPRRMRQELSFAYPLQVDRIAASWSIDTGVVWRAGNRERDRFARKAMDANWAVSLSVM